MGQSHSSKDDRKKNKEKSDPLDRKKEEKNYPANDPDPPTYEEATSSGNATWDPYKANLVKNPCAKEGNFALNSLHAG